MIDPPAPKGNVTAAIALAQANERLRQERELFNQRLTHEARWFFANLALLWTAILIIPSIAIFCAYVVSSSGYSGNVKTIAASTLFVDVVGVAAGVWRGVVRRATPDRLEPTTAMPAAAQLESGV